MLKDVFVGALSPGVNATTLLVINGSVVLLLLIVGLLAWATADVAPELTVHWIVIEIASVVLLIVFNWLIANIGIADPVEQAKHVESMLRGGDDRPAEEQLRKQE